MTHTGGIVLCGGRSSRMGRPKAWLPVGGEVLLQRVVRVVGEAVGPVVVVAGPGQDVPPLPNDVRVVRDEFEGVGPLAGLAAGLAALAGEVDAAYLSACDVPFLTAAFVRRVVDGLGAAMVCAPLLDGRFHPLAAAYRLTVRDTAVSLLAANRLRITTLCEVLPTRALGPDDLAGVDPDFRALRNVNTPAEYAAALELLFAPPTP